MVRFLKNLLVGIVFIGALFGVCFAIGLVVAIGLNMLGLLGAAIGVVLALAVLFALGNQFERPIDDLMKACSAWANR